MSRGVNQVQYVFFAFVHIFHLDGMAFNGNTTFTLQFHIVQHLSFRHLDGLGKFQETVGQCRLAMVYMCNNAKVSYMVHLLFVFLI